MLVSIQRSLEDLCGSEWGDAVVDGFVALNGGDGSKARALVSEQVEFWPPDFQRQLAALLPLTGKPVAKGLAASSPGAPTFAFAKATTVAAAPIGSLGPFRLGEDGRLYLATKSEHYHAPLGHSFPGYRLIENAKALGIPNATHNNTRGHITRLLETEIVRTANGLARVDGRALEAVLASREPGVLNRIINLETGSLATEAALKMMLARFYRLDPTYAEPLYADRVPVFLVMADNAGGNTANYHGTTLNTQLMRGLWPGLYEKMAAAGILRVQQVRINDSADFEAAIRRYNVAPFKTAGFLHEIIMMNYGGIRLSEDYLRSAYALCRESGTPILCDEIQSCMWYPGLFLSRIYGLKPDFLALGKGFSGGLYPASRILTTAEMDTLNQFGALVTNGQEELASLAYLVTMAFVEANGAHLDEIGRYYEGRVREVAARHPGTVENIEGQAHLVSIGFKEVPAAVEFCKLMLADGFDISAQTYKPNCPPVALTKLPVTLGKAEVDWIVDHMDKALRKMEA
ncbi:MAG: aminotransferase class III-fold pyridoxal phosphate-dependent enzyme [Spirochaetota bacterium]